MKLRQALYSALAMSLTFTLVGCSQGEVAAPAVDEPLFSTVASAAPESTVSPTSTTATASSTSANAISSTTSSRPPAMVAPTRAPEPNEFAGSDIEPGSQGPKPVVVTLDNLQEYGFSKVDFLFEEEDQNAVFSYPIMKDTKYSSMFSNTRMAAIRIKLNAYDLNGNLITQPACILNPRLMDEDNRNQITGIWTSREGRGTSHSEYDPDDPLDVPETQTCSDTVTIKTETPNYYMLELQMRGQGFDPFTLLQPVKVSS